MTGSDPGRHSRATPGGSYGLDGPARRNGPAGAGTVEVRPATAEDAALLADLGARTFRDTYLADNAEADIEAFVARWYQTEVVVAELADPANRYLIATAGPGVVPAGFALLRDSEPPQGIAAPDAVHGGVRAKRPVALSRIYVDKPFLGEGIGAALMRGCEAEARRSENDLLWLTVWDRNERAIAFYRRWGMAEAGETSFTVGSRCQRDLVFIQRL